MISGIVLILIILGLGGYSIVNFDKVFRAQTNVSYPDGCVETYENAKLVSDECLVGRSIVENNKKMQVPTWNLPE